MIRSTIRPVILCGGSGTRLWPLSRKSHPKQFSRFLADDSLLQETVRRLDGLGLGRPLMMTSNDYRFVVGEHLEVARLAGEVVVEPAGRNTAPALAAAAVMLAGETPDALMFVAPSDHVIGDEDAFGSALDRACVAAAEGHFVTFGITPGRPETGYGYIELSTPPEVGSPAVSFERFVEKPDEVEAAKMLETKRYLWNSGMFLFPVAALLAAFEAEAPEILAVARKAVEEGQRDLDFFRLGPGYGEAEDISIDYAIMEKTTGKVVPMEGGWNDLGSWKTVWQESAQDSDGVALAGASTALACKNTLLRSEQEDVRLVGIGLKNIAAIAMRDAVLVADMEHAQDVKAAVAELKAAGAVQAIDFPRCYRPWGWYETLVLGQRFQVKQIMVKPGGILSLQSHHHRSEHWIVVAGTAQVTVGEEVKLVTENQSVYIPLGAVHRMENPGKVEMHLIEVQTGVYLGEDDIVRYEDVYARV